MKIYRIKSDADVYLATFLTFAVGVGLWIAYGLLAKEAPIVFWNGVTLVLAGAILVMKFRYG